MIKVALAGIAQWIECRPVNRKVTGSIPGQDTCLGCGPGTQMGECEMFLSLSFSFPSLL